MPEKYNARILYDPLGMFKKGAEIPWFEFAIMLRNGDFAKGTRIEKVAQNSTYRVSVTEHHGKNCIVDNKGRAWTVVKNSFNNNGLAFKRNGNREE